MSSRAVEVTNPGKVLFPDGTTKLELVEYYTSVAGAMVPHLRGRPLTIHRFPNGIDKGGFLQKNASRYFPDWIERVTVEKSKGTTTYVLCNDTPTLRYLANQAAITFHVWPSRADRLLFPDRLIFDLDPSVENFALVRDTAVALRRILEDLGLVAFLMTTGSRGLHVVAPLDRTASFDEVGEFADGVARILVGGAPDALTTEFSKAKRGDRLFVDTRRNVYAQHAVAAYSVRARDGAPVATPLQWDELPSLEGADTFTIREVPSRVRAGDPWAGISRRARALKAPRKLLEKVLRRA
jgi:bifunctional non-homologous end joining protein LigD